VAFSSLTIAPSSGTLTLGVSITGSSVPTENIYITYIVYQQNSQITYSSYNIQNPSAASYTFIGIEQLNNGVALYSGSAFNSATSNGINCVGNGCPSSCISSQACSNYGGQVYGGVCYICGSGQVFSNGACQAINNCGANQHFGGTSCVCNSGYIMINNICYLICGPNAYIYGGSCICQPGYSVNPSTNQCALPTYPTCTGNEVLVGTTCVCPSGYGRIDSYCTTCPTNSYVNNTGLCTCYSGYTLNPTKFSCDAVCWANSYRNSIGQCICNNGYYAQGNQCIPNQNCQGGMVWTNNGCACPTGQYIDSITNVCTYCNTVDRQLSGSSCICAPTYYPTNTGCSACVANSYYDSTSRTCICNNGYSYTNGQCLLANVCSASNQYWSFNLQKCLCVNSALVIINGVCQTCPANSQSTGSTCICIQGYNLVGSSCVPTCPLANTYWNGQTCVCNTNYYLMGGTCLPCDPNSVYNITQGICICNPGYWGSSLLCSRCDSSCATCSGPSSNQCSSCISPKTLNNGVCSQGCQSGYFMNNGQCTACLANCAVCSSTLVCTTCATGYNPGLEAVNGNIVMVCKAPITGTTTTLSLKGNVIGNSIVFQGIALSIMPTAILTDNCNICNDLLLVNYVSTYSAVNINTEYVINSQYWFIIYFDFNGASFIPSFQFTVQINPLYAQYFNAADMTQKVSGTINPTTGATLFSSIAPATPTSATSVVYKAAVAPSSSSSSSSTATDKLTPAQMYQIFK